jgi:glycosyltransferase involved in cell wall biosynthesis
MAGVRDITLWRNVWGELIELADEVQLFSPSSLKLLARAYPKHAQDKWRMLPHGLLTQSSALKLQAGRTLHIGVVGTLGAHKGAKIVAKLAQEITGTGSTAQMTIFGTIQTNEDVPNVTVTGPYTPEALRGLMAASGANIFLFPSIWPETFSYVAHELCAMGVPIVCFDQGAQADLVKCYAKGKVLPMLSASALLPELMRFWEASYPNKNELI